MGHRQNLPETASVANYESDGRLNAGSVHIKIILICLKIKAFHANATLKGTYKGTYGVNLFNMQRLVFSPIKRYTSGNKKGRYYTQATIPQEHRHLYNGSKQISRSLGSYASEAEQKRDLVVQEENRRFQKKLSDYDPLVASAEKLIEALFATYDLDGTIRPERHWLNQKLTKESIQGFRDYTGNELDDPELQQLINLLKLETAKLLVSGTNLSGGQAHTDYDLLAEVLKSPENVEDLTANQREALEARLKYDCINASQGNNLNELVEVGVLANDGSNAIDIITSEWTNPAGTSPKAFGLSEKQKNEVLKRYDDVVGQYNTVKSSAVRTANQKFEDEEYARRTGVPRANRKWSDAMDAMREAFMEKRLKKLKTVKTFDEYVGYQKKFLEFLNYDKDLADIDFPTVNAFVESLDKQGLANGTIQKHVSGIISALKRAKQLNWIPSLPFDRGELELSERGKEKVSYQHFEDDQLRKFFTLKMSNHHRMCFIILASAGFRLEEAASLNWNDIRTDGDGILFYDLERPNKILKTEWAIRKVPVHREVIPYLEKYKVKRGGNGNLFDFKQSQGGKVSKDASMKLVSYVHQVRDYENYRNQDKLVNHSFRTTFTTLCKEAGVQDSTRWYIGGWKQMGGQDATYLRFRKKITHLQEEVDKVVIDFIEPKFLGQIKQIEHQNQGEE